MQTCSGKLPKWSCSSLAGGARRRLLCSGTNIDCRRLPTSPATRFKHIPPQNRLCALNSPGADDELSQCPPQQSVLSRARAQGGCTSCSSHEELEPRGLPAAHHACTQGVRSIVFASALLGLGLNQEAWADEIPAPNSEAFISTTYDPVISIIFGFIVLCLVIVTGGVSSVQAPSLLSPPILSSTALAF